MNWKKIPRWLYPGLNIKRWIVLLTVGVMFLGLGAAYMLIELYRRMSFPPIVHYLTLQFLDQRLRGLLFLGAGLLLVGWALSQLSKSLTNVLLPDGQSSLISLVYERRGPVTKPKVVVFGSGIGLLVLLGAIKDLVSAADIVLPMGEDVTIYRELLRANRLILRNVWVSMVPHAAICAEFDDHFVQEGLLAIKEIRRQGHIVRLFPHYSGDPLPSNDSNAEIVTAVKQADVIIFAPASLHVGIIPSLLARDVAEALAASSASKVYICNIMTEPGKTDGFSVSEHVNAIESHGNFNLDYVIINNKRMPFELAKKYQDYGAAQVLLDLDEFENTYLKVDLSHRLGEVRVLNKAILIEADLISTALLEQLGAPEQQSGKLVVRHDPEKLGLALKRVFDHVLTYRAHTVG
jgi:2-phospho-L-lactate transferase/gluconeogenesis factor (CofD/UPF0052 family)